MKTSSSRRVARIALAGTALLGSVQAGAYTLYESDDTLLNFDFEAAVGVFNSQKAYNQVLIEEDASPTWRWCEAFYASANLHTRRNLYSGGLMQICEIRHHF